MFILVPAAEIVLNLNVVAIRNTSIAGESNSFICIVTKNISGLELIPQAVWINDNDTEITEQDESNATLIFSELKTSDGKEYTCQGNLSSPALSTPHILVTNYSLVVKSKLFY